MRGEHGLRLRYWCLRCPSRYNRKGNLRVHYREPHPDRVGEIERIEGETYEERNRSRRSDSTWREHSMSPRGEAGGQGDLHLGRRHQLGSQ